MLRRLSAFAISAIIAFTFTACSLFESDEVESSKQTSSQQKIEYISVKDYASKGEIYGCEFALKTSPDDIKAKYHYGEEIEDTSEESGAHDHDSEEAYAGDLIITEGDTVKMYTGSAKYYYRSWLESDGIAFIACFDDTFSYYINLTSVQDVLDTVDAEPIYNDIADSENLFFFPGEPENVHQLKYQFDDYFISFFFENDCLSATTIYYAPLWTDYETE